MSSSPLVYGASQGCLPRRHYRVPRAVAFAWTVLYIIYNHKQTEQMPREVNSHTISAPGYYRLGAVSKFGEVER